MTKITKEEAVKQLMEMFYVNSQGDIEWSYIEGVSIDEMNPEAANVLIEYMDEKQKEGFKINDV